MLKLVSFHNHAHLNAFLQILEYFSQICLGPLARESLCIFISTSVHVSGNYVPIIRRTYCSVQNEKYQYRVLCQLQLKLHKVSLGIYIKFCYFFERASLYNPFQMKPTRCTLLLSIFISTSIHVWGNYVPIIRRTYCSVQNEKY